MSKKNENGKNKEPQNSGNNEPKVVDSEIKKLHEQAIKDHEERQYGKLEVKLENNEVYDDAELASAYETSLLSKALEDHKQKMAPQKHPGFDGVHCIDCEDDIAVERLKMGRIRCTDCQEHFEYVEKRKGQL